MKDLLNEKRRRCVPAARRGLLRWLPAACARFPRWWPSLCRSARSGGARRRGLPSSLLTVPLLGGNKPRTSWLQRSAYRGQLVCNTAHSWARTRHGSGVNKNHWHSVCVLLEDGETSQRVSMNWHPPWCFSIPLYFAKSWGPILYHLSHQGRPKRVCCLLFRESNPGLPRDRRGYSPLY